LHLDDRNRAATVAWVNDMHDPAGPSLVGGQAVELDLALASATSMIERAERIVVLTGAGISTDSRIPDYRGPQGVWTRDPEAEKLATLQNYLGDPEVRQRSWRGRLDSPIWAAEPNRGHLALVRLETRRKLVLLITQNVDGLHHEAGSDPERIVEVHGNARRVVCMSCTYSAAMQLALDRVRLGEADPDCPDCGGILKSATISFGQNLVAGDLHRAQQAAESCDLLLAVGSTLAVYPVANVVPVAKLNGAAVVIVNGGQTEMDELAEVVVRASISDVLPALCG
jgi:NAD-dependent deacetylase